MTSRQPRSTLIRADRPPEPSALLIPAPYRVVGKIDESPADHAGGEVVTLEVVPVAGDLFDFRPAQVSMLGVFGVGEAAISISSATSNREYHAYTIRRAGPISGALVDTPIGGEITVRGPFGEPWPIDEVETSQLMIVGGGLGMAPLRAVAEEAVERLEPGGLDRLAVVYGARSPGQLMYWPDLGRWEAAGAEIALTVDSLEEADGVHDVSGEGAGAAPVDGRRLGVGLVTDALAPIGLDWADTTAFVCGPDVMMHFTALRLVELGVPAERIWFTTERNMQCGNALCGHCQLGPLIVCRDGPVVAYADIARFFHIQDL
jgi:NAD(P)H-flavin reductase